MKKILLITMVLLTLSFMLFAQKMEKKMMMDDCKDCKEHPMMMQKGEGGPQMMNWDQNMMKELNLNKDQIKKLDTLRDEHKKQMNTNLALLKNLQIDKQNAMQAENYMKVKQLNKNISDLELESANKKVDHHQLMLKELTDEQKTKLQEMKFKGKPGMKKGMMMEHNKMEMKKPNDTK